MCTRWAPTSPPNSAQPASFSTGSGSSPARREWRTSSHDASQTPVAESTPKGWIGTGPRWRGGTTKYGINAASPVGAGFGQGSSLHEQLPSQHVHAADVLDLAALLGREIDRHRLVQRQLLLDVEILDDDLRGASGVRLASDDQVDRFVLLHGDVVGLEALVRDAQLDGPGVGGLCVRGPEDQQRREDCYAHVSTPSMGAGAAPVGRFRPFQMEYSAG